MKKWTTEIFAKHNVHGEITKFCGPHVEAPTLELARQWCIKNCGYLHVTGHELVMEIPCKPGTWEADWDKAIDYDNTQNN